MQLHLGREDNHSIHLKAQSEDQLRIVRGFLAQHFSQSLLFITNKENFLGRNEEIIYFTSDFDQESANELFLKLCVLLKTKGYNFMKSNDENRVDRPHLVNKKLTILSYGN